MPGEGEICYVENGHLPDEVARREAMLGEGSIG